MKLAIISGSGMDDLMMKAADTADWSHYSRHTPYGETSDAIIDLKFKVGAEERDVLFLARHGLNHEYPPHLVPYAANIWALKAHGATHVISVNAVGSLRSEFRPGDIIAPTDVIDHTSGRQSSFSEISAVLHASTVQPFCPNLRGVTVPVLGLECIYLCIDGPRFATRVESVYNTYHAHIVGMTVCPEVWLAREAGLHYLAICHVTDYDSWKIDEHVTLNQVLHGAKQNISNIMQILMALIQHDLPERHVCKCRDRDGMLASPDAFAKQDASTRMRIGTVLE